MTYKSMDINGRSINLEKFEGIACEVKTLNNPTVSGSVARGFGSFSSRNNYTTKIWIQNSDRLERVVNLNGDVSIRHSNNIVVFYAQNLPVLLINKDASNWYYFNQNFIPSGLLKKVFKMNIIKRLAIFTLLLVLGMPINNFNPPSSMFDPFFYIPFLLTMIFDTMITIISKKKFKKRLEQDLKPALSEIARQYL